MSGWYVLMVTGGMEHEVLARLLRIGVGGYVPMGLGQGRWLRSRRARVTRAVAMPGYVLVEAPEARWYVVMRVVGVLGVVGTRDRAPLAVSARAVARVMADEAAGLYDAARPEAARTVITRGTRVEVVGSVWDGWVGVVVAEAANDRAPARVEIAGRPIAIPLDKLRVAA